MSNEIKSIQMPKWGMEMSEGDINAWHVEIGAQINAEDDLVDVETSKIINTVIATHSGVLRAIIAQPGETHDVGALLGVRASAETSEEEIQAFIDSHKTASADAVTPEPVAEEPATVAPLAEPAPQASNNTALAEGGDDSHIAASPVARRLAAEYGVNLNNITGTGRRGRISKADLEFQWAQPSMLMTARLRPHQLPVVWLRSWVLIFMIAASVASEGVFARPMLKPPQR